MVSYYDEAMRSRAGWSTLCRVVWDVGEREWTMGTCAGT